VIVFPIHDMSKDYLDFVDLLTDKGEHVSPRGMGTYELENVTLVFDDPRPACPVGIGRKYSHGILAAETMQWLAGVSDLRQLDSVSKGRFSAYADRDDALYGAYGPRTYYGFERAVKILAEDLDSRRAVVNLWSLEESTLTNDLPCTLSWGFLIRDGRLNMTTTMRSNDAFTGVTYDVPAMTRIQSAVAWALGVDIGRYTHVVHSMHLYEQNLPAIEAMGPGQDDHEQPPLLSDNLDEDLQERGTFVGSDPSTRWRFIRDLLAGGAVAGDTNLPSSFEWFARNLRGSSRNPYFCPKCRYYVANGHPGGCPR
jgi:thymidylate synthase